MRSLLSRQHYFSPELFATERERVFKRLWILAAIRPMVARHLDFRTLDIGGVPVIVQNFRGRIRAFANICQHRLSRIHRTEFGNRALVCPYHHWTYNETGALAGMPKNATMFQFDAAQMAQVRLKEFAVETVGGLVFVNLDEKPLPIAAQFDADLLALLASATGHMDDEYIHTRYPARFNWKTGMENIKDPLHVQCLHRDSFPDYFDTGAGLEQIPAVDHAASAWRAVDLKQTSNKWDVPIETPQAHEWYDLVENLDSKAFYRGIHLFPNVNLMVVAGTSFAVQVYNPIGPEETEMHMSVVLTRPLKPFPYKPVVLWEHLKSDMKVLQEDIDCLEALQPNFAAARSEVTHGAYEAGIMDFHAAYLDLMGRA